MSGVSIWLLGRCRGQPWEGRPALQSVVSIKQRRGQGNRLQRSPRMGLQGDPTRRQQHGKHHHDAQHRLMRPKRHVVGQASVAAAADHPPKGRSIDSVGGSISNTPRKIDPPTNVNSSKTRRIWNKRVPKPVVGPWEKRERLRCRANGLVPETIDHQGVVWSVPVWVPRADALGQGVDPAKGQITASPSQRQQKGPSPEDAGFRSLMNDIVSGEDQTGDNPPTLTGGTLERVRQSQRPIVLLGLMGAGKSAIGRRLAQRLGWPFNDSDAHVEDAAGMPIVDIFKVYGEPAFRDAERRVIQRLLSEGRQVLALGGGAFMDPDTRSHIADSGTSVWLRASLEVLVARTSRRHHRPLLNSGDPETILGNLIAERYPIYQTADLAVESGNVPLERTVNAVLEALASGLANPRPGNEV